MPQWASGSYPNYLDNCPWVGRLHDRTCDLSVAAYLAYRGEYDTPSITVRGCWL